MGEELQKRQEQMGPFLAATNRQDYEASLAEIDRLTQLDESYAESANRLRFQAAAMCGRDDLIQQRLEELWNEYSGSEWWAPEVDTLAHGRGLSNASYLLGIKIAERGMANLPAKLRQVRPLQLNTLALLYYLSGDRGRAIELEREAIAECERSPVGPWYKPGYERTLERFEKNLFKNS